MKAALVRSQVELPVKGKGIRGWAFTFREEC